MGFNRSNSTSVKHATTQAIQNSMIFEERKCLKSLLSNTVWDTKSEFVPKSIIFELETSKLVKSEYFPKSFSVKVFAIAVKNKKPKPALKILPALTKDIFVIDRLSTFLSYHGI